MVLILNKKLNYDVLAQLRDKNEIIEYLKSNNIDYSEKILQLLKENCKSGIDKSSYLTLKQLESVAAGVKDFECKLVNRHNLINPEEVYLSSSFAQRCAIRQQLFKIEVSGKSAIEHFNGIDIINKENCTLDVNGRKYICFPDGSIVQLLKEEIPAFNKKIEMGVDPQVAAAFIFNGSVPGIPKVENQYASVTNSYMKFNNGSLIINVKPSTWHD